MVDPQVTFSQINFQNFIKVVEVEIIIYNSSTLPVFIYIPLDWIVRSHILCKLLTVFASVLFPLLKCF